MKNLINIINKKKLHKFLTKCNFGMEKENVRVDLKGHLALTHHPKIFGNKFKNKYITTDFSESQIEMITPVLDSIEESYDFLDNLQDIISTELKDEYLWPQSTPPYIPTDDEDIPISQYEDSPIGNQAKKYRDYLSKKYGKKRQLISGIHYNFSFKDEFLHILYKESQIEDFKLFKDSIYLKMSKNFFKYRWILIYLFGSNPTVHKSYEQKCINKLDEIAPESFSYTAGNSFRNGECGYKNSENFYVSYSSRKEYVEDIKKLISSGKLINEKEYYSPIRLKAKDNINLLNSIEHGGIDYLEMRLLDLNPMVKNGISIDQLYFVHIFLLFCLFTEEESLTSEEMELGDKNHQLVAHCGRKENLNLHTVNGLVPLKELGVDLVSRMEKILISLGMTDINFTNTIREAMESLLNSDLLISTQIENGIKKEGFIDFNLNLAKKQLLESQSTGFTLKGYEQLELSTQILLKSAIKRGLDFEVLDEKECFISLSSEDKTEYVVQATKTSLDSYSAILVMENKLVTKKILEKNSIKVPLGGNYININDALINADKYIKKKIVIKPNSTNFGLGITILPKNFTLKEYEAALKFAFAEDETVLIEEFIEGKEYRFLVLKNRVAAILHRVPANIRGNGKSSIKELVEIKNRDPLRGIEYKKPLQEISLGEAEKVFLSTQNLTFESVPNLNQQIYLRENSNISTGGDSIDFSDDILDEYKDIAIKAAKSVDATICGVDMIIKDRKKLPNKKNHGILELNFNPAIHIHCYPYRGKNRNIGDQILDILGF